MAQSFPEHSDYTAQNNPVYVVSADFNNDGYTDLATTNAGSDSVSIYLGSASGTLTLKQTIVLGSSGAWGLIAGDLNNDGNIDLVPAMRSGGAIPVLLGNGDGTFTLHLGPNSPVSAEVAVMGDFNRDGNQDLVFLSYGTPGAMVFMAGNGNGTFTASSPVTVPVGGLTVVAADFNGDGLLDLAWGSGTTVSVALGNGNGTFQTATTSTVTGTVNILAAGDFNNDGKPDVAAQTTSGVNILLGKGDGTVLTPIYTALSTCPNGLAVADFNGDGNLDVATTDDCSGTPGVSVMLGTGTGALGTAKVYSTQSASTGAYMTTGDFNGDGRPDLAVASYGTTVSVLLNYASTTGTAPVVLYGNSSHTVVSNYAPGSPDSYLVGISNNTAPSSTVTLTGIYLSYNVSPALTVGPGAPSGAILQINTAGSIISTATDSVTLTITGPNGYSHAVTHAAVAGLANFSQDAGPTVAGAYTYTFTFANPAAGSQGSVSANVTVNGQVMVVTTPYPAAAQALSSNPLTVALQDGAGNLLTGFTGTVTVSCPTDSNFTTQSHTYTAANAGSYTFTFAMPDPGTQTLLISAGGFVSQQETVVVSDQSTVTTLVVSPSASPQTASTVFTLTASTVTSTGVTVTAGPMNFYDGVNALPIASVQMHSNGSVSVKTRLSPGTHNLTAQYQGLGILAGSTSTAVPMNVTAGSVGGTYTVTPTISISGNPGSYTITSLMNASQTLTPPGTVTIVDTTNANAVLATATASNWAPAGGVHNLYTTSSTPTPLGNGATWMATGDFNNDGIPDLAVVNVTDNTLDILLGVGDGTFTIQTTKPAVCSNSLRIAAGDFNQDGYTDLVVMCTGNTNYYPNKLTILISNGNGTFTNSANFNPPLNFTGIAVGDFNNDGILDFAVAGYDQTGGNNLGVQIYLGTGSGTFNAGSYVQPNFGVPGDYGPWTGALSAVDLNHDGNLDLILSDPDQYTNAVEVALGNGTGSFTFGSNIPGGFGTYTPIRTADFNRDGKMDMAMAYGTAVRIFLGNGSGGFTGYVDYPAGSGITDMVLLDINNDGLMDIAVSNSSGVGLLLGKGDGTFQPVNEALMTPTSGGVVAGNFNGVPNFAAANGTLDILLPTSSDTLTLNGFSFYGNSSHTVKSVYTPGTNDPYAAASSALSSPLYGLYLVLVTPPNASITAGQSSGSVNVNVKANGNLATTATNPVTLTVTGPNSYNQTYQQASASGLAAFNSLNTITKSGTYTFLADFTGAVPSPSAGSVTVQEIVNTGPLSALTYVAPTTTPTTVGTTFSMTVIAGDAYGNTPTTPLFTGTVTLTSTDPSFVTQNYTYQTGDQGSHTFNNLSFGTVGTFTLTASTVQSGITNAVQSGIVVTKNPQTITFPAIPAPVTYGNSPITLAATASSGLAATYSVTGPATLNGSTLTITGAGSVVVTASQVGNGTYAAATAVPQTITVIPAVLTVTANPLNRIYGAANPTLTDTITGFVLTDTVSVVSGSPVLSTTATTGSGPGMFPISVGLGTLAATNYTFNPVAGTLTIGPAPQTITFTPTTLTYGAAPFSVPAVSSSGLPLNFTLVSGPATLSGSTLTITGIGTIVVSAAQAGNANYSAATTVQGSIPVNPGTLTVTANNTSRPYNTANPTFAYQITGYAYSDTVAVVSGAPSITTTAVLTSPPPGPYLITPAPGTLAATNYTFAFATGTLTINESTQTITFPAIATQTYGASPLALTATASSGLAVAYSIMSGPATVNASTLTLTGVGTVVVSAAQAGNADYYAATSVPQSFTVTKGTLTITANSPSRAYGVVNPAFTYTPTGFAPGDNASVLSGTPTITTTAVPASPVGPYPIALTLGTLSATNYNLTPVNGVLTVAPATPAVSVASNSNPAALSTSITFTATVTSTGTATGTVTFNDGATSLGSAPLTSSSATLSISTLAAGSHSITAVYSGDTNNATATSSALTQQVNASSALSVVSSSPTSVLGNPVTFTLTVTSPDSPTGTVKLYNGTTLLGSATLSNGSASIPISGLPAGSNTLTAVYSGDSLNAPASQTFTQTVVQATTTTVVDSPATTSLIDTNVTLTATVAANGASAITGTVTFLDGSTSLGTGTVGSGGVATLLLTSGNYLALGLHSITAAYSGDSLNQASTSLILTHTVQENTTTTLVSGTNPTLTGVTVTFTATLAPVSPGTGVPTGSVTFYDGTTPLLSGTIIISGTTATFTTSSLSDGLHSITGVYNGDISNIASSSNVVSQDVQHSTTTPLTSSANPSTQGENIIFTATVLGGTEPTGTVNFLDASTLLGSGTLANLGGVATTDFSDAALAAGTHPMTAAYQGDSFNAPSTSPVLDQVVLANTTTTLTSNMAQALYTGQIIFTATVTSSLGTPTGTVNFYDGSTLLGPGSLNTSGIATYTTSNLALGTHSITATYVGDAANGISTSSPLTQTVREPDTVALTSSANPAQPSASVTFTVVVTPTGPGLPTGTVTFYNGSTSLGTGTLSGNPATTTLSTSTLALGSHSITASYAGDSQNVATTSNIVIEIINQTTTVTLASNSNPSLYSNAVTLTATVTPSGSTAPTGVVTFSDNATAIGTGTLNGSGVATYNTSSLAPGQHSITVNYPGDSDNGGASSTVLTQTVQENTATTVTVNTNPSIAGNSIEFTATVTASASGATTITPTGTVTFEDGATAFGMGTVNGSGVATLNTAALPAGTQSVTAVYGGDTINLTSQSAVLTQVVDQNTTMTVASSTNPSGVGNAVIFTATIPQSGASEPGGTVTFLNGATVLGTAPLSNGSAAFTYSGLGLGVHTIQATYAGDGNYAAASATVSQTVKNAITITITTNPANPVAGSPVTFTATVTSNPAGTPTGTVTFNDGATVLETAALPASGVLSFTTSSLPAGPQSFTATYSGDANNVTATSAPVVVLITGTGTTSTTLSASATDVAAGSAVLFTANVTSAVAGTPTGTVSFFDNGTMFDSVAVTGGIAAASDGSLTTGVHAVYAVYSGDSHFEGSQTGPQQIIVNSVGSLATTTTVTSANASATAGATVTFTATVATATGTPTGTVNFFDNDNFLGTGALTAGVAQFASSALTVGAHAIEATYSGDSNYAVSESPTYTQTITAAGLASTTVALTTSNPASPSGADLTFTATITSPTPGTMGGSVNFFDNNAFLGTVALGGNGTAQFSTTGLIIGTHSVWAAYSGDPNYSGSQSARLIQIVNPPGTAVTITALTTSNPSVSAGVSVTFTATVSSAVPGTITGTMNFFDNNNFIGTAAVTNGSAQLSSSTLAVGWHAIFAAYQGDTNFAGSQSLNLTQIVTSAGGGATSLALTTSDAGANPLALIITRSDVSVHPDGLTTSNGSVNAGVSVTFTATVSSAIAGTPTGTVTFFDNNGFLATVPLGPSGIAQYTTSALAVGTQSIFAAYSGDSNYAGSQSASSMQTILSAGIAPTTSVLVSSNPSVAVGASVNFFSDDIFIGNAAVNNGVASISISTLALGTHSILAAYSGDSTFAGSESVPLFQTVQSAGPAATSVSLVSSNPNATAGSPVTFTADVASGVPGTPTGTVNFFDNGTFMGSAPVGTNGIASFTTPALGVGAQSIVAAYSGDANFAGSQSGPIAQVIQSAGPAATSVTLTTTNPSVTQGTALTFTATITSTTSGTFTGSVSFFDNITFLGTVTPTNGAAQLINSSLSVGTHSIFAAYTGDSNYSGSASPNVVQVIISAGPAATSTVLQASANNVTAGTPVTFTATISSATTGTITGSVNFFSNNGFLGNAALSNGVAQISTSTLPVGTQAIFAAYSGDANFAGSQSGDLAEVILAAGPAATATVVATSSATIAVGTSVTFTATVSSAVSGTISGSINFFDNGGFLGASPLGTAGSAQFSTTALTPGTHSISAAYTGNTNFAGSQSAVIPETVTAT